MGKLKQRAYKDVTLQQMRSFAETARLGSMTAAAESLGITVPTVWIQVRALEREFGEPLIVAQKKGCTLTEAGKDLAVLIGPLVSGAETLKNRFGMQRQRKRTQLVIATTPRIATDDLPVCFLKYQARYPQTLIQLLEFRIDEVADVMEAGEADIGLVHDVSGLSQRPLLEIDHAYDLEYFVFAPTGHPLARGRSVSLDDLKKYPFVHSLAGMQRPAQEMLEQAGVIDACPRQIDAFFATSMMKLIQIGFGIGLIACRPSFEPPTGLVARPLGRMLGQVPVYFVWRRRALEREPAGAFAEVVRETLGGRARRRRGTSG